MSTDDEDICTFRLLDNEDGGWWYEYAVHPFSGNMAYLNFAGAGFDEKGDENVRLEAQAERFSDLDWSETALVQPDSDAGWLDRDGRFYGCHDTQHDMCARYVLKKRVGDLEATGWVRVYGLNKEMEWFVGGASTKSIRLSAEQRNWLSSNGYLVNDYD